MASAVRSTALVVSSRSAKSFSCWRSSSNEPAWPTTACLRRTHALGRILCFQCPAPHRRGIVHGGSASTIVRTGDSNLAHSGPDRLGAQLLITGSVAATARNATLVGRRDGELQPLAERRGSGVMHGGTLGHLDRLQIETAPVGSRNQIRTGPTLINGPQVDKDP
jgi:hypothetical protein